MSSTESQSRPPRKVSRAEIIVLAVLIIAGLSLLLPTLPKSREAARANLCRRNLRGMYQLTSDFVTTQRRLPDAATWPVDLLPRLQFRIGDRRHADIFTMPRPNYLTCPAQADPPLDRNQAQPSNYEFVVDRDPTRHTTPKPWSFQDLPANLPSSLQKPWYIGRELSVASAKEQRQQSLGPHAEGTYIGIDDQGRTSVFQSSR